MILLVALGMATAAWAQAPAPKKEPAKPVAEAPKEKAEPQKGATVAKKSRRQEDARHCLDRGSNIEIIKCAEEYL